MAALVLKGDQQLDGKRLYRHLARSLPAFAWPWFLRITVSRGFLALSGAPRRRASHALVSPPELSARHRNLQAAEEQAGAGGLQPRPGPGSALFPPRVSGGLRSPERIAAPQHRVWRGALMNAQTRGLDGMDAQRGIRFSVVC